MDTVFVVLHVVSGVFLVGPMAILPMAGMRALRAREAATAASTARSVRLYTWLSLIVVIFGFGALGMSDPKYHTSIASTWIWLSLVAYVVAMVINLGLVVPALRRAAVELASTGVGAPALASPSAPAAGSAPAPSPGAASSAGTGKVAGYARVSAGSGISALLLVLVVVLMVVKP